MTTDDARRRIYCALDTDDLDRAVALARRLRGLVGGVKLGLQFFAAHGPRGVARVAQEDMPVFLDLKFHDIPHTVAAAVRAVLPLGPEMLTVHAAGGRTMLEAARDAAAEARGRRPKVLAVTVLTSLGDEDLAAVGQATPAIDQVLRLAALAQRTDLDGIVCSPLEVARIRPPAGRPFLRVVPGIRPGPSAADDQKRTLSPAAALAAGADILVIGRPITGAADPADAARRIGDALAP